MKLNILSAAVLALGLAAGAASPVMAASHHHATEHRSYGRHSESACPGGLPNMATGECMPADSGN